MCCNTECKSGENCSCLENIEKTIIDYSENRDCNLRIFGGSQIFFEIDYEIIKRFIAQEFEEEEEEFGSFLKKRGYEPIFNFLLGCYLSDKFGAKFNSNVYLKFGKLKKEVDLIVFLENEANKANNRVFIIETTREHAVCSREDYCEKLENAILNCIPVYELSKSRYKFKYILVTLFLRVIF